MQFLINNWILVLAVMVSGGMLLAPMLQGLFFKVPQLSPTEATLLANREHGLFLDVREPHELAQGSIANAKKITLGDLPNKLNELNKYKQKPIIVVCQTGARARIAQGILAKAGFEKASCLTGGMLAWQKDNLPVIK